MTYIVSKDVLGDYLATQQALLVGDSAKFIKGITTHLGGSKQLDKVTILEVKESFDFDTYYVEILDIRGNVERLGLIVDNVTFDIYKCVRVKRP